MQHYIQGIKIALLTVLGLSFITFIFCFLLGGYFWFLSNTAPYNNNQGRSLSELPEYCPERNVDLRGRVRSSNGPVEGANIFIISVYRIGNVQQESSLVSPVCYEFEPIENIHLTTDKNGEFYYPNFSHMRFDGMLVIVQKEGCEIYKEGIFDQTYSSISRLRLSCDQDE